MHCSECSYFLNNSSVELHFRPILPYQYCHLFVLLIGCFHCRVSLTKSPTLAFNALCYFDFFQPKNISFLTQIVSMLISILTEENQFIPFNLLKVLVCILHVLYNHFCEDSASFLHSPLFSPYLLFIHEIILLCHLLHLRCTLLLPLPPRHPTWSDHSISTSSSNRVTPPPLLPTRHSLLQQSQPLNRHLPLNLHHCLHQ